MPLLLLDSNVVEPCPTHGIYRNPHPAGGKGRITDIKNQPINNQLVIHVDPKIGLDVGSIGLNLELIAVTGNQPVIEDVFVCVIRILGQPQNSQIPICPFFQSRERAILIRIPYADKAIVIVFVLVTEDDSYPVVI